MDKEEAISYKQAVIEIEDILQQIESNELDVDDLSKNVKRVAQLIKLCKAKLHNTEKEVNSILDEIDD